MSPLGKIYNLDPKFESLYKKVQSSAAKLPDDKKPAILAWVSPLEEHLLHYLPLKVKKATLPEEYDPLNFKNRYINDFNLISLSEAVYHRLDKGQETILILKGWSNFIKNYEISDQQFLLALYITRVLKVCLWRLHPNKAHNLEIAIINPVPQGSSPNLVQAPNYSLSLARRLALMETFSVPWSYFNPGGIMEEIFNHNKRNPTNTFMLYDNSLKIITRNFAKILEISFAQLICNLVIGTTPDDAWQAGFQHSPLKLPDHLDIFNCSLDKQGLDILKHGLAPATLPISSHSPHYHSLPSHSLIIILCLLIPNWENRTILR